MSRSAPEVTVEEVSAPHSRLGVTRRSILLGLLLVCAEVAVITFSEPVVRSSQMNISHFPVGFFMWFVAVVLFLNPLLKRVGVRYGLSSSELFAIVAVGLMGAHVPNSGLVGFFLGMLAAPYYFASPENRWAELLHPNIPPWLAPTDERGALQAFFEGAPDGYAIPWHVWAVPLFWWLCLIGAMAFALLCIAVMLRKQWVQNERLVYPLISPVSELSAGAESPQLLPQVAYNRLFWIGFGLGFGILAWNIGAYFLPSWPRIYYHGRWWDFLYGFPRMTSRINMYIIGFGYFANVDVLFSLLFFYLLYWTQTGVFNRMGYNLGPGTGTAAAWESTGGLFALVGWGMWTARGHLREVVRKALDPACPVDDSGEMFSYRTALFGFLLGTAFSVSWLYAAGVDPGVALLVLAVTYVTYVGLAKVVSESGLLYLSWTVGPQALVTGALGSVAMAPGSILTSMAFTVGLCAHWKGIFMSGFAQGAKLAGLAGGNRRRVAIGMGLALAVGILLCLYLSLGWGYEYGAYNFGGTPFRAGRYSFQQAAAQILNPEGVASRRLVFFGIGVGVMSVLTFIRYRLSWWPVHPIGFAIAGNGRATKSAFSVFIAWTLKFLTLRVGGVTLYWRFRPLFVGLLSGYSLGVGLGFAVDAVWFHGQGHWIHLY